jgi:hypothetical protein
LIPFLGLEEKASKRDGVRVGFRTLCSLALCAAAAGAALAHSAIDVLGDYALAHDSYDHLAHNSRELITGVALFIAFVLAARGLRNCCEIAAINRTRLFRSGIGIRESFGYVLAAISACCALVPAMEWLDGRLDGVPVKALNEAFGGSLLLGLGTTLACASLIALLVFAMARWLVSHRDVIAAIIETLLGRSNDTLRPSNCRLQNRRLTFRLRAPQALSLSRRGPPVTVPV